MRITNQILNRGFSKVSKQNMASRRHRRAPHPDCACGCPDDPAGFVGVLSTDRRLAALDQYRRGISSAKARQDAEEGVLDQVTDLLSRGS